MKTPLFILLVIGFYIHSCKNEINQKQADVVVSNESDSNKIGHIEPFGNFINKFYADEKFQKERICFPLINLVYDIDKEGYDSLQIKDNEWQFFQINKLSNSYIKNTIKINDKEYEFNIQLKETGVFVKYTFKLINDKWHLTKIVDEST